MNELERELSDITAELSRHNEQGRDIYKRRADLMRAFYSAGYTEQEIVEKFISREGYVHKILDIEKETPIDKPEPTYPIWGL